MSSIRDGSDDVFVVGMNDVSTKSETKKKRGELPKVANVVSEKQKEDETLDTTQGVPTTEPGKKPVVKRVVDTKMENKKPSTPEPTNKKKLIPVTKTKS